MLFLPVGLGEVSAQAETEGKNAIQRNTLCESATSHFVVERSLDGHFFKAIESIDAAGYAFTPQYYNVIDPTSPNTIVYYRILQVDLDGTSSLSPMVAVPKNDPLSAKPSVYPNPGTEEVRIENAEGCDLILQDLNGNVFFNQKVNSDNLTLQTVQLAAGVYILRFIK